MGILNEAKGGADLTHPHASVGWVLGATIAVVLLAFVAGVGLWLYGKAKTAVGGGKTSTGGADVAGSGMGSGMGAGWL